MSYVALRPDCHGTNVRPSGLFPSSRLRPFRSLTAGTSALMRARWIKSLSQAAAKHGIVLCPSSSCTSTHVELEGPLWHYYYYLLLLLLAAIAKSVKVGQHGKNTDIVRDMHSSRFTVLFAVGLPIGFSFNYSVIQWLSLNSDICLEMCSFFSLLYQGRLHKGGMVRDASWRKLGGKCCDDDAFARIYNNLLLHEYIYYFTPVHF